MTDDFSDEWLLLQHILDEWELEQGDETVKIDGNTTVDAFDIAYIVRSRFEVDEVTTPEKERFYDDLGDLFFCIESQPDIRDVWDVVQSHNERFPISEPEFEIEVDPQEYRLDADDWCDDDGIDVVFIDYDPSTEHIEGSQVHKKH